MGTNSILVNLSESNTVSEIKLLLAADFEKKNVIMLVEGEDDVKLFKFLVTPNVTLIKAYGACTSIDSIIPKYFAAEKRVIGVRDKDYQTTKHGEHIFYCDYSCAEMMMISDDETFDKMCTNHYRGNLPYSKLRRAMLSDLYNISIARKLSTQQRWGLKIGDTDLAIIVGTNKDSGKKATLNYINSYNKHNGIVGERAHMYYTYPNAKSDEDYFYITNGHDFVEAFCIYCAENNSNSAKRRLNEKTISIGFRLSYSRAAFSKTKLYRDLSEYQTDNNLSIVFV